MRLVVLGGGGFRVPLVFQALLDDAAASPGSAVTELVLHDLDPARLATVGAVLARQAEAATGPVPRVRTETDLVAAVTGADFVFSAIRVGGLAGRVCDERAALDVGVLGQETTGAGGVTYGLRTVPVAVHVARTVQQHAPDAFVINFTNPAGMVTEAMAEVLGDRVVGICDSPVGMFKRVARVLGVDHERAFFDYAGLNHLGWLRRVVVDGEDLLPRFLADPAAMLRTEEGRLFDPSWLTSLGAVPNEYLWYWYYNREAVEAIAHAGETRGEYLARQQGDFYDGGTEGDALARWVRTRRDREESYMADSRDASGAGAREEEDLDGGGYDRVALQLMRAIARDEPATLVLNVPNRGLLAGLDTDAVVEVPCVVDAGGPRPLEVSPLDAAAQGLVTTVKAVERATIEAALSGSRAGAVKALALHPLVDSVTSARTIVETHLSRLPDLARVLVRP
ncbi:MAG: 6-phospho-beta-glucosidase [Nocardioidaceae bacterium]|nr:6-phospho-beta-glucosidase [Nocardioidaceae bacterium]